ncbi:MAG: hypothetical protein LE180_04950 [Endomicrobium sp.]|uniref:hypothetical protein n=1 Tax=Candidatus Endomicrobiellum pyrsonymphae TaxID=1408203 RepID=UPI0035732870|nr:hypothetical protein [Endomicrobium sp.]
MVFFLRVLLCFSFLVSAVGTNTAWAKEATALNADIPLGDTPPPLQPTSSSPT